MKANFMGPSTEFNRTGADEVNRAPFGLQVRHGLLDVPDLEGHVLQPLAMMFDEAGYRTVRAQGLHDLNVEVPQLEEAELHSGGRDGVGLAGLPRPGMPASRATVFSRSLVAMPTLIKPSICI